ncbi:collagen alpha-3(VI) chain isoform A [Chlorella sorokiniana]|uniref:Collagen alpha-3(VI) chain isoform A n=1 Tax=Chlorella sorokiniana TaxID=3076 RepID=A0A2P6TY11_CHLSO|nr:collagen alpha-3(VI) chain isoform A [Chlorella sorokiniana]|eukprot:PRW58943.1 collagen alpha-3(VI) chain isoform A [Chlorella sorokiniana]
MRATAAPAALLASPALAAPRRLAAAAAIPALPLGWVPRPAAQRPLSRAAAASSSADKPSGQQPGAGDNPILEKVVQVERQNERGLAYGALAVLLGGAGLALLAVPQRCVEFLWAATPSVLVAGITRNFGSVLLLVAVCAHCLKEAAEHGRMQSETYRRLNLGLLWWGLGSALALWLAPAQPLRMGQGLMTALLLATAWHAGLTYQETDEQGLKPGYLFKQFLGSLGNLASYSNTDKSAIVSLYVYGLAAKTTIAAAAAHLLEGKMRIMSDGLLLAPLGSLGVSLLPLVGVGYLLVALVLFTQKDAARRGRLGASTFKSLNAGLAIVGLAHAASLAGLWQAGALAHTKLAAAKIAVQASLAAFALYNYAFAKK